MPVGDAVQTRPTTEQEIAKFKSFATQDGEVSDPKTENLNPATNNISDAERKAGAKTVSEAAIEADGGESEADEKDEKTEKEAGDSAESQADKTADADDEDDAPDEKAKHKKTAQQRISDLTRARRTAERERDAASDRAADLERRLAKLERGELTERREAPKKDDNAAPAPEDFEYGELDTRYIRALARYEARQELAADRETQKTAQEREAAAQKEQKLTAAKTALETAGTAKYDDFDEVVVQGAEDGDWPLSTTLGELVLGSKVGHDIAYHLASNPKEARQVFGKTPLEQAAYFGRLEARFTSEQDASAKSEKKTEVAKTTKAPPPVRSARGAGGNQQVSPDTQDFKSFEALAMRRQ